MMRRSLALLALGAALTRDAGAKVTLTDAAVRAHDLTIGLDLDAARTLLATADATDPYMVLERARLALYDGDCDAAALALSDPTVAKLDAQEYEGHYQAGLGDIARGCARAIAGTSVFEDKAANVWIRFQDDDDRALAPLLVETLVKARETLTRELGVDWPKPTRVVVVRDLHALSAMTGLPYESASTTGTIGVAKWGRVTLLSPRASQHGFPWRDTLAHELTHLAVTHASGDRAPLWLQEGLAKREEIRWRASSPFDDRPSPEAASSRTASRSTSTCPSTSSGPPSPCVPERRPGDEVAFAEAVTSFVHTMVDQAGDEATKKLLKALRDHVPVDEALTTATGSSLGAWDKKWRAHLASVGASPPASLLASESKDARTMREGMSGSPSSSSGAITRTTRSSSSTSSVALSCSIPACATSRPRALGGSGPVARRVLGDPARRSPRPMRHGGPSVGGSPARTETARPRATSSRPWPRIRSTSRPRASRATAALARASHSARPPKPAACLAWGATDRWTSSRTSSNRAKERAPVRLRARLLRRPRDARRGDFPRTIDRAAAGGASVDRVGYAFLAGYRAALSALDPLLGRASLCATEEGGAHPAQIATRLEGRARSRGRRPSPPARPVRRPSSSSRPRGVARRGIANFSGSRAVRKSPARRDGVTIRDRPPLAFAPEIPHAEVVLANVRVEPAEVAPGDAYEKVLKPFRTLEDAHVTAALLGHIARHTADRSLVEQALAVLPALAAVSERSASSPEAHVILAGALAHARAIALSADAALYKPLLDVAANVRSRRTEAAWAKLLPT